jgi:hypothetical protein
MAAKALRAHKGSSRDESFHATMLDVERGKRDECSKVEERGGGRWEQKTGCSNVASVMGDVRAQLPVLAAWILPL